MYITMFCGRVWVFQDFLQKQKKIKKNLIIIIFVGHWYHRDIWKWLYYCYSFKVKQFISTKHRNKYHCLLLINDIQSYGLNFVGGIREDSSRPAGGSEISDMFSR